MFIIIKNIVTSRRARLVFLILICLLAVFATAAPNAPKIKAYFAFRKAEVKIKANPAWAELYQRAQEGGGLLKDAKNEENYIAAAFRWKSLADAMGERIFYLKALEIYDQAISRKDFSSYLSSLNAGNVSRTIKEFERADKYFLHAIELNPGEAGTYMTRAELLRYDLRQTPKAIKEFYLSGLKRLIGREYLRLAADYAVYLKETGDYEEALKQYKLLLIVMPAQESFKTSITEIEKKLKESP